MGSRPGPIEKATQAPGEIRVLPAHHIDVTVAQFKLARRLIDECNGNVGLVLDIVRAVADA